MDKQGSCWQITFEARESVDDSFSNFLEEYFDVVACNYTDEGLEEYVGYKCPDFDANDFEARAKDLNLPIIPYKTGFLQSENWLKDYVIRFDPFEVEDFLIYGVHEQREFHTPKIPIKIYAATAFGSNHQTTTACLTAISKLNKMSVPHSSILDVGTGSGILSLAAAKLWDDAKITAVDIDEEAVWVTRQNAVDNNVSSQISADVSNGYASEIVSKNSPYDIILSNILARPLIDMSQDLYNNLKSGGYCVLSGFNQDQEDWVISTYQNLGFSTIEVYKIDTWRAVLMRRN